MRGIGVDSTIQTFMRLRSSSCFQPDNVGMAQKPSAKHALLGINGSDGGADAIPSQLDALVPGSLWPHRRHTLSALLVPTGVAPGTETGAYEGDILGHIAKNLQLRSPMDWGQHLLHTAERTVCDQVWRIVRTRKDWQVLAHNDRVFAHLEWQITRGGTQGRTTDRTVYSHGRRRKIGCASCAPLSRPRRSQSCRDVYAGGSRARRIRGGPSCCRRCWRPAAPWATLPPARGRPWPSVGASQRPLGLGWSGQQRRTRPRPIRQPLSQTPPPLES